MGHKHAALMLQYAQDAAETETPWERWYVRWPPVTQWRAMEHPFFFIPECEYRRKPVMVTMTISYPEPCREAPSLGQVVFVAAFDAVVPVTWSGDSRNRQWLDQGRIHLDRDSAEQHRKGLLGGGEK